MRKLEEIISNESKKLNEKEKLIAKLEKRFKGKKVLIYSKFEENSLWNAKGFDKYQNITDKKRGISLHFKNHIFDFNYDNSKLEFYDNSVKIKSYYGYNNLKETRLYILE
ncbi:MAG: hypothetical protein ACOCRX_00240 [Candidatus Woesearchaeota archaeon]